MKIVNRAELATMPNGTLYCSYVPDMLNGDWNVITGHHDANNNSKKEGFHSTLPLEPFLDNGYMKIGAQRITNWSTVDTCDCDYEDDKLFAVFDKSEIRAMITILQYALSDCGFDITNFINTYYCNGCEILNLDRE